ncbi:MAG TPA: glycine cleavage system aminomethyltransferase GcvT [Thermodesulfobacteriota bacterium]|nr:glycine cleavage system aminomethyltransferase GcvT [Thermodesulfobacteriota bacterium]
MNPKRTAIFPIHRQLGAKIVEFAGWEMPVQYEGLREEHLAVRRSAGLFDVSHMGEIEIRGKEAARFCQYLTTNDVMAVKDFQAQYTLFCNREGGVVDDVILYRFSQDRYLFCVNASNTKKDHEWIAGAVRDYEVDIENRSPEYSQLALQGPRSEEILSICLSSDLGSLRRFHFIPFTWNDIELIIARTGYTGEDGFEIFLPWNDGPALWESLTDSGRDLGIKPCGLGARDTLRIEMGYSLYGHEINDDINPFEAGLGRYVKMDSGDFIGRDALLGVLAEGPEHRICGFEMTERGIPREGYRVFKDGRHIGRVTSGTLSPSLEKSIGMGYLKSDVVLGDSIQIEIRNTFREARVVNIPFYRKDIN